MRQFWCKTCKGWIPYPPGSGYGGTKDEVEASVKARAAHDKACGFDDSALFEHPDLLNLDAQLDSLYLD